MPSRSPTGPTHGSSRSAALSSIVCPIRSGRWVRRKLRLSLGERVSALLRVFLAPTQRYQPPPTADAERYYSDALAGFSSLEDHWMVAWIRFECADLAIDEQRLDDDLGVVG
jgi:hypothetical protein